MIKVGPSGDYLNIGDAIRGAREGDTILVGSGTYNESLIVDRRLSIVSNSGSIPVITGGGSGDVIHIIADGVQLKGLAITGSGRDGAGIRIDSGSNRIEDCSIYENDRGINMTGQSANTIAGCDIYNNGRDGIFFADCDNSSVTSCEVHDSLTGISLLRSRDMKIEENNVSGNGLYGIWLNASGRNLIDGNKVQYNADTAVNVENASNDNAISENDISNNALSGTEYDTRNAVNIYRSSGNYVTRNRIVSNGGTVILDRGESTERTFHMSDGVGLVESESCVVKDNVMSDDHYAIWIFRSKNCSAIGNSASGEFYNIVLEESSGCTVADNVLKSGGRSMWIKSTDHTAIRNNTMSGAGLSNYYTYVMTLTDSSYNDIEDNTIVNNPYVYNSIWLSGSSHNTLKGNKDYNNGGEGIWFTDGSAGNRAYLNDFQSGIASVTSGNYWSSPDTMPYTYNGKSLTGYLGNYWAGYRGADTNGDGTGDSAYSAGNVLDSYPLAESRQNYLTDEAPSPTPAPTETPSTTPTQSPYATPLPYSGIKAGFHASIFTTSPFPGPEQWYITGKDAASKFEGSDIGAVWVIGGARADGQCYLNFPSSKHYDNVVFSTTDENGKYLSYFDSKGILVILQVEPGEANVSDLIRLVLNRYGQHPCVAGVGVDVEWYRFASNPEGRPVTDEEAATWYKLVTSYNKSFTLALTHWRTYKMPPTYREGIYFLYDGYAFGSFNEFMGKCVSWGQSFPDSPVGYYIGFVNDRNWWSVYPDPYNTIGHELLSRIPNTKGVYWVNGQHPRE